MNDRYLKIVRWAERRYTRDGKLVVMEGNKPSRFTRIEIAAWKKYVRDNDANIPTSILFRPLAQAGGVIPCGMVYEERKTGDAMGADNGCGTGHILHDWGSFATFATFRVGTFGGRIAGLHPHHIY